MLPRTAIYQNPLRDVAGLVAERVDQGVDYAGTGPVYALGPGRILNLTNSGWPGGGFIVEHLDAGPLSGRDVYVAENITPNVAVGQRVNAGSVIGHMAGGIETGFAAPAPRLGESLAMATGQATTANPGLPTALGTTYARDLAALGAPPGTVNGKPVTRQKGKWKNIGGPGTGPGPSPGLGGSTSLGGMVLIGVMVLAGAGVAVWGIARATGAGKVVKQAGQQAGQAASLAAMA